MADAKLPEGVDGFCDARFGRAAELIASQIASGLHHGVAVAAFLRGEPVVDLWAGKRTTSSGDEAPWERDTMSICFSTTKGILATALHIAMDRTKTSYDATVASVWPEFGTNGKAAITIRQLLCHEAGVPQIRDQIDDVWAMCDWQHMVGVMEGLEPLWEPGSANGYHAINFAWLIGETLRRIDGRDVETFIAEEIAGPLELDGLHVATPANRHARVAPLIRDGGLPSLGDVYDDVIPRDTIGWKALAPRGDLIEYFNSARGLSACVPSISGVFTARSVAKVYAMLERGGSLDGTRLLSADSHRHATTVQNERPDLVMIVPPRWRLGYMSGGLMMPVLGPNTEAYGHVGAGGTVGGADPKAGVSWGLVYDLWHPTEFLGGPRSIDMSNAIVSAAQAVS